MKNLILVLLLLPLIAYSHESAFKDNEGRQTKTYEYNNKEIKIKDNRGRQTGYIKNGNLYDNRGRKQGEYSANRY